MVKKCFRFWIVLVVVLLSSKTLFADDLTRPIRLGGTVWVPIMMKDKNGNSKGLYFEFLQEIFNRRLNKEFEIMFQPWKRIQLNVNKGKIDMMIAIASPERLQYAIKSSQPLYLLYLNLYTYKDHPKLKDLEQIKTVQDIKRLNLVSVTNLGNGWHQANVEKHGIRTLQVNTEEAALKVLALKRADIMIDFVVTNNHLIKQLDLTSKIELTEVQFGPIAFHLLMSKKSPFIELMPEIDKAINDAHRDKSIEKIVHAYSILND